MGVFMQNTQTTLQNEHFGMHSIVLQAKVLAITEVAKNLLLIKNAQSKYCCAGG